MTHLAYYLPALRKQCQAYLTLITSSEQSRGFHINLKDSHLSHTNTCRWNEMSVMSVTH